MKLLLSTVVLISLFLSLNAKEPLPMSITVSGGVSLGSYQAGYHYIVDDWIRVNRNECKVHCVTGASAGAVNALLTVFSLADTTFCPDTQSLFYKTWIPVSFNKLKGGNSALGVFNRDFINNLQDSVITPQFSGFSHGDSMDIVLGITATLITPLRIQLKNNLSLPSVEDKFVVRMKRSSIGAWELRNFIDPNSLQPIPVLPLHVGIDSKVIASLMCASSGFPGAFEPLTVKQCRIIPARIKNVTWDTSEIALWQELRDLDSCGFRKDTMPAYIDGGVFDNAPLRLACNLGCNGLYSDSGTIRWAPTLSWCPYNPIIDSMRMLYISQENVVFPKKTGTGTERQGSFSSTLLNVSLNLFNSARAKELCTITERFPLFNEQLILTDSYAPTMSAYLMDFLGFFETPFRIYDFYTGMYDAQRFLGKFTSTLKVKDSLFTNIIEATQENRADARYLLTKEVFDLIYTTIDSCRVDSQFNPDSVYWQRKITNVNNWFKAHNTSAPCGEKSLRQHAIMVQTSVDRLWARWTLWEKDSTHWTADVNFSKQWKRLTIAYRPTFFELPVVNNNDFQGNVLLPMAQEASGKMFTKGEFDALLFLLEQYQYEYQDILSKKRTASQYDAKTAISDQFSGLIRTLAKNQAAAVERTAFKYVAKPVSNVFSYSAPSIITKIGGGTDGLTIGFSPRIGTKFSRLRADTYLTIVKGSKANIGSDEIWYRQLYPSVLLGLGGTVDILPWNALWQLKIGSSAYIGKDWMLNSTKEHLLSSWTIGLIPITFHLSLLDIIYARLNIGGQKSYDFELKKSGKWDWTRWGLQAGVQVIR